MCASHIGDATTGDTIRMLIEGVPPRGKKRGEQREVAVTVGARGVANIETVRPPARGLRTREYCTA